MAAPISIIEQVLRAISVIPFARTVDEIEVAQTHLSISCSNLGAIRIAVCDFGVYDLIGWHGGYLTMAITIIWRSP
jgi:hypothetical protein